MRDRNPRKDIADAWDGFGSLSSDVTTPSEPVTAVVCSVRKPDGVFLTGIPRLVGSAEPPTILGSFSRSGSWLNYEATFPDFFAPKDVELPEGRYQVIWGTVAPPGGRAHVLAQDSFDIAPR